MKPFAWRILSGALLSSQVGAQPPAAAPAPPDSAVGMPPTATSAPPPPTDLGKKPTAPATPPSAPPTPPPAETAPAASVAAPTPPRLDPSLPTAAQEAPSGVGSDSIDAPVDALACVQMHEHSQELRYVGKLREARTLLRLCASPSCPGMVRTDCSSWLAEIERTIPTLRFELHDTAVVAESVRLFLDGEPSALVLNESLDFDPGSIRLRLEAPGHPPLERTLVLREGEKNRVFAIRFPSKPQAASSRPRPNAVGPRPAEPGPDYQTTAVYLLAGTSVASALAATYFAWSARDRLQNNITSCKPLCSDGEVRKVRVQLLLADISGGVALASGAVALFLHLAQPTPGPKESGSKTLTLTGSPGGLGLGAQGRF